ncbi:hypothetical protein DFA_02074 [Cavenderia fasciculata]|uniref:FNIP repeat-containing protein n=1 Tax=Cavenderia fasciculata TaxID=261658 RepID=F4PYM1_CACFS|nr:uncharacterized protein DFA_02074 [Cavenderia fasciculata]EGG19287.1 hypothetical protein DFA_02074 [Cavenderia fasciculata]|eukprot:XP_004357558.1 hypothetical protein DFA_02074 [Cavenderia fasciculata]
MNMLILNDKQKDYINKISAFILLNIINHVTENVDLVCLLLTCKRLFNFSTVNKYHQLSFKPFEFKGPLLSDKCQEPIKFFTIPFLHLGSFSRMYTNAFSDTMILSNKENIKDKEKIAQIQIIKVSPKIDEKSKKLPETIEKIEFHCTNNVDFKIDPSHLGIDKLTSLKILKSYCIEEKMGTIYCSLPTSLTHLSLHLERIPSPTYFKPLINLVHLFLLILGWPNQPDEMYLEIENLVNLKILKIGMIDSVDSSKIHLSPNLLEYTQHSGAIPNRTTEYFPPTLTILDSFFDENDFTNLSLGTRLPHLTSLSIHTDSVLPMDFIPARLKTLRIFSKYGKVIKGRIPDSVEPLYSNTPISLPRNLEEFSFVSDCNQNISPSVEFIYPPTLISIEFGRISNQEIPSVNEFKYIPSKFTTFNKANVYSIVDGEGFILPLSITKITVKIEFDPLNSEFFIFRLDHLINQTNIDQLVIDITRTNFQVDIRRLDPENNNIGCCITEVIGGWPSMKLSNLSSVTSLDVFRPINIGPLSEKFFPINLKELTFYFWTEKYYKPWILYSTTIES